MEKRAVNLLEILKEWKGVGRLQRLQTPSYTFESRSHKLQLHRSIYCRVYSIVKDFSVSFL